MPHLRSVFLHRLIFFGEKLRDKVRVRSPKKLKILIEVPNLCQVKAHFFSFNMMLLSSQYRVPTPNYPFRNNYGRPGTRWLTEQAKIVN